MATRQAMTSNVKPDRYDEAAALHAAGKTVQEIADRFELSPAQIRELLAYRSSPAVRPRFSGFPPRLAQRLAERYPDAAAIRAASDAELLRVRGIGAVLLQRLRAQHPHGD